jgi:hypothetical protein
MPIGAARGGRRPQGFNGLGMGSAIRLTLLIHEGARQYRGSQSVLNEPEGKLKSSEIAPVDMTISNRMGAQE